MKRFLILLVMLFSVSLLNAGAIWTNYQLRVSYENQAKVKSAIEDYVKTSAGQSFPGLWLVNALPINGSNPATHNMAIIYENESQWEQRVAELNGNQEMRNFAAKLYGNADVVSETVYEHVAGFGLPAEDSKQWIGYAMRVKNPNKYLKEVENIMVNNEPVFSVDVWAVKAGGDPGVTHVAVIGVESRAEFFSNEAVMANMKKLQRNVSNVRQVMGTVYANLMMKHGPLTSAEYRK